jgi:hypothetical protein
MIDDPVLREIRAYRDQLADRFKDDPAAFHAWIKAREEESRRKGRTFVSRRPRRVRPQSVGSEQNVR